MDVEVGDKVKYEFELAGVMLGPCHGTVQPVYPWNEDVPNDHVLVEMEGSSDTVTVPEENILEIEERHTDQYTGF